MNKIKLIMTTFAVVAFVGLSGHYAQNAWSEARLNNLLTEAVSHQHDGYDPAKEPARKERAWRLYQLWLVRNKRDITPQVVPFLDDEYWLLRHNAARMLGKTESRVAESHLQKLLVKVEQGKTTKPVSADALRLSLARNRTRGLKGRAKLAALAKGLGLSFDEIVQLPTKVRAERLRGKGAGSQGEKIVREMVDMLYTMGERGDNIQPLVAPLTLLPAQKILLQGAGLPPNQQAKRIVDYLAKLNVSTPQDAELTDLYLPGLGVHVTRAVLQRLNPAQGSKVQLGSQGRSGLVDALRWNKDPRALVLLKTLRNSNDPWVRNLGSKMPKQVELLGKWSSPLSPNPPMMQLMLEL